MKIRTLILPFVVTAALILGVVDAPTAGAAHTGAKVDIREIAAGNGDVAERHSKVVVHYTGWLKDGTKFDSSLDRGKPFSFTLGGGQVIPGWEMGVEGMKVGGKRELTIPPELAYGAKGAGGVIPPNATLKFEIELLSVAPPLYTNVGNDELKALLERGVKLVDIRRPNEWAKTGVIEGSKKMTAFDGRGRFVRKFPIEFEDFTGPDDEVIVICRVGNRSAVLSNMLTEQASYTRVYNVKDGIMKWIKEGNPVVK